MTRTLVLIVLLVASGTAAAQIYRWTDEQGRVHYGSQPPPGQKADSVKQQGGDATPQDMQRRQREASDRADRDRQELERHNQCQEFESRLRQVQSGGDPGYYGRPATDEERQAMVRQMLAMREHVCR